MTRTTETNGHTVKVIEATGADTGDASGKPPFFYADCQNCDWTGEGHAGDDAEREAFTEGEGHETDMSFDRPQMGGEPPVLTEDPLTRFLYLLLRDEIQPGAMERIVLEMEDTAELPTSLCNKFVAGYAENIAARLRKIGSP